MSVGASNDVPALLQSVLRKGCGDPWRILRLE